MADRVTIKSFTDLVVWQRGHLFALRIYKVTKSFPEIEKFGLSSQLRRAAVSITSNIAEGFSRSSRKEKQRFYSISLGSLAEIQNQILIAKDLNYISKNLFLTIANESVEIRKMLFALVKTAK